MSPRVARALILLVVPCVAVVGLGRAEASPRQADAREAGSGHAGPGAARSAAYGGPAGRHPRTEITPAFGRVMPLKNQSRIVRTVWGYRYVSGQQNSRLTISPSRGGLLYRDTGTQRWRDLPAACRKRAVSTGIAAWCRIPEAFQGRTRMFLEVWPRLGADRVDGSRLTSKYRLWVLADKGRDRVLGGAGADFVNGAQGLDRIWGGGGNDWLRGGKADDQVHGGAGADQLLGMEQSDVIDGGPGADAIYCGPGADKAFTDAADRVRLCERVS
ncbi:MAG: calcium-binding protein [Nocardioidaceae bacterium]